MTPHRWVARDEEGRWVDTYECETREQAIRRFCYPALLWPPFEADGWTMTHEAADAPLGEASPANMRV